MRHVRTSVLVALLSVAVVAPACAASRSPLRPATVPATTPTKTQPSKPTLPSQVINLTNWRLVLPTGPPTKATVVSQPALASYSGPDFQVNAAGNGVVFTAPVGGSTYGSQYPRSELDEVTPGTVTRASWLNSGPSTNVETLTGAVLALPPVVPKVALAQIHSQTGPVPLLIIADGTKSAPGTANIEADFNGTELPYYLATNYKLGTTYTLTLSASNGQIVMTWDGVTTMPLTLAAVAGNGWFFKAGCYPQSNPAHGDSPTSYGQTVIYGLQVIH